MVTRIANAELEARLRRRLDALTKPPGSLGRLEDLAVQVGLIQGREDPAIDSKGMVVFCGNHGVVSEGVSAYPREVTSQMVTNFRSGGAAINVLCRQYGIEPVIVDMEGGRPTGNLAREAAMSRGEVERAIEMGKQYATADIVGAGEMGIGNSTVAAALLCAFVGLEAGEAVGRGTGLDEAGMARKGEVVRRAMRLHPVDRGDAVGVLTAFGGFEICGIVGLILGAAEARRMVVLDGFVSCAAALAVQVIAPAALDYVVFSHRSAERGHRAMLEALAARPLLDLEMRLGEGTGAALGIGLVESAVRLYREMATFEGAGVSTAMPRAAFPSRAGH